MFETGIAGGWAGFEVRDDARWFCLGCGEAALVRRRAVSCPRCRTEMAVGPACDPGGR